MDKFEDLKLVKIENGTYRYGDRLVEKECHPLPRSYYQITGPDGEFERVALDGLEEVKRWLKFNDPSCGSSP
jgi:hypothetical protein